MKTYSYADNMFQETFNNLLNNKQEFNIVREVNPRVLFIEVTNEDNKTGMIMPDNTNGLPYSVKINNIKERIVSNKDIVFYIDHYFIEQCRTDEEIEALVYSLIYSLEIVEDKNGEIKTDTDGRAKIKIRKTDISLSGYSAVVDLYGDNSPEKKSFNNILNYLN